MASSIEYAVQGITVSAYYSWQRKVFQAVTTESEACFAEISAKPAGRGTAASIENGELRTDIHTGADMETVRAIIQSLKEYYIVSYSVKHPGKGNDALIADFAKRMETHQERDE